ncbi:hypothetical protein B0H12DRAFT_325242 [Mycena haematopus]|nr:hypothetical protein B0H12DRAFT_325242 [Mycena haematopus]
MATSPGAHDSSRGTPSNALSPISSFGSLELGQSLCNGKGMARFAGGAKVRYDSGGERGADGVNDRKPRSIESKSSEIGVLLGAMLLFSALGGVVMHPGLEKSVGLFVTVTVIRASSHSSSLFSALLVSESALSGCVSNCSSMAALPSSSTCFTLLAWGSGSATSDEVLAEGTTGLSIASVTAAAGAGSCALTVTAGLWGAALARCGPDTTGTRRSMVLAREI